MNKKLYIALMALMLALTANARAWYDPSTRSFLSRDPLREGGNGPNGYWYCTNNPLSNHDPLGLSTRIPLIGPPIFDDSDPTPSFIQSQQNRMAMWTTDPAMDQQLARGMLAEEQFKARLAPKLFLTAGIATLPFAWIMGPELAAGGQTLFYTSTTVQVITRTGVALGSGYGLYSFATDPNFRGEMLSMGPTALVELPYMATRDLWGLGAGRTLAVKMIPDEAFVRFDPTRLDDVISSVGIQQRFFDQQKVWLTKYGDIKNISNAADLEQILYRQDLWPQVSGKFSEGATLRLVNGIDDAVPAGVTNKLNGVRQWRLTDDIPASDLEIITRLPSP